MTQSESILDLAGALVAAQSELENAHKNATNPHFKSDYADLAEIINTVRPVLNRHGLAVVQIPGFTDGVVTVETLLAHASGQWLRGVSAAPAQKLDPQGVGSAITYLRRYSLAALCGIAQEDDDGEAAAQLNGTNRVAAADNGTRATLAGLVEKLEGVGLNGDHGKVLERAKVLATQGGPADKVTAAIAWAKGVISELEGATA